MNRELRLFLLAIALPSVLVAVGGARLLALEAAKDRADKSEANELRTAALAAGVERLVAEDARILLAPLARETNTQGRIVSGHRRGRRQCRTHLAWRRAQRAHAEFGPASQRPAPPFFRRAATAGRRTPAGR